MWVARAPAGRAGLPRSAAAPKGETLASVPTIQYPDAALPADESAWTWAWARGAAGVSGRTAATATARAAAIRRRSRVVRGASEITAPLQEGQAIGPRCGPFRSGALWTFG